MKLMTTKLEELFAKTGRQEDESDPLIVAKFFDPTGGGTWFTSEYSPSDRTFFGYVQFLPGCDEWGYFSLDELQSVKVKFGLGIERDIHFTPRRFSALQLNS